MHLCCAARLRLTGCTVYTYYNVLKCTATAHAHAMHVRVCMYILYDAKCRVHEGTRLARARNRRTTIHTHFHAQPDFSDWMSMFGG